MHTGNFGAVPVIHLIGRRAIDGGRTGIIFIARHEIRPAVRALGVFVIIKKQDTEPERLPKVNDTYPFVPFSK